MIGKQISSYLHQVNKITGVLPNCIFLK